MLVLKVLLWIIISVSLGLWIIDDPGYVLIAAHGWVIESPLWLWLLVLFMTHWLCIWGTNVVGLWSELFQKMANLFQDYRISQAVKMTNKGYLAFSQGQWQQAEKALIRSAKHSPAPVLNYLTAAQAAQHIGDIDKRDLYLYAAQDSLPGTDMAVGLTQAKLQMTQGQWLQSLETLKHLQSVDPGNAMVLHLLKDIYEHHEDWESLVALLPALEKTQQWSEKEFLNYQLFVYEHVLSEHQQDSGVNMIQIWKSLPSAVKANANMVHQYALALSRSGQTDAAETHLRQWLKKHWDDEVVICYGLLRSSNVAKQLSCAEHWAKKQSEPSAALLLTLGRLCLMNQLWGQAENYLKEGLALMPRVDFYVELAALFEWLDQKETASYFYKHGLLKTGQSVIGLNQDLMGMSE